MQKTYETLKPVLSAGNLRRVMSKGVGAASDWGRMSAVGGVSQHVAVVVATHCVPNPNKHNYVVHKDGNLYNCHPDNLEWHQSVGLTTHYLRCRHNMQLYMAGLPVPAVWLRKINKKNKPAYMKKVLAEFYPQYNDAVLSTRYDVGGHRVSGHATAHTKAKEMNVAVKRCAPRERGFI